MKKTILEEYRVTKNKGEDFLYWLLVRKLNAFGKIVFAIILWILWLKYGFNLKMVISLMG